MKKIGILYVGIGEYIRFWEGFYKSCEQYFCTDCDKHYYVVTDQQLELPERVTVIPQADLGWPGNTSFRFLFFLRAKDQLKHYDYLIMLNGNTRFKEPVTVDEVFPGKEDGGLVALTWKTKEENPDDFPFERRAESAAFVPYGTKQLYVQGGFHGGFAADYLEALEECHRLTMADFNRGIIAVNHDESVINKYMQGKKFKLLDSTYGRPSQRDKQHTAKIVFQRKEDILGRSWLRHYKSRKHTNTWLRKLLRRLGLVSD